MSVAIMEKRNAINSEHEVTAQRSLLDELASRHDLLISDLHDVRVQARIESTIQHIPESQYTAQDWCETLTYIFGEDVHVGSAVEAKAFYQRKVK